MSNAKNPFEGFPTMDWTKDVAGFWSKMMSGAGPTANVELLDRIRVLSRDNVAFVEERVRKDMEFARRLTEAKTPADVGKIQMEFFQSLVTDYNKQAMRMAEEAGKTMTGLIGKWPGTGK